MKIRLVSAMLAACMALTGCASVMSIPDKAPCTGLIKTNGDCIGQSINAPLRGA